MLLDNIIVAKQLPIDEASRQRLIDIRTSIFNNDVENLAERVFTGEVSVGQFEESMKKLIRELHTANAAIGKGGWNEMTWQDWGRLGPIMKEQYRYLHGFSEYIADNKDTMSIEYLKARSRMYGNASSQVISMMTAGFEVSNKLPWLPGDPSTRCQGNCLCRWELNIIGKSGEFNIVKAVWRLSPAEHCEACLGRNGYEVTFKLYQTIEVPKIIGHNP